MPKTQIRLYDTENPNPNPNVYYQWWSRYKAADNDNDKRLEVASQPYSPNTLLLLLLLLLL